MGNINGKNYGLSHINYALSHKLWFIHVHPIVLKWFIVNHLGNIGKNYGLLMFIYDLMGKDGEISMVKGFEMG
jgi:hypothetical protein